MIIKAPLTVNNTNSKRSDFMLIRRIIYLLIAIIATIFTVIFMINY